MDVARSSNVNIAIRSNGLGIHFGPITRMIPPDMVRARPIMHEVEPKEKTPAKRVVEPPKEKTPAKRVVEPPLEPKEKTQEKRMVEPPLEKDKVPVERDEKRKTIGDVMNELFGTNDDAKRMFMDLYNGMDIRKFDPNYTNSKFETNSTTMPYKVKKCNDMFILLIPNDPTVHLRFRTIKAHHADIPDDVLWLVVLAHYWKKDGLIILQEKFFTSRIPIQTSVFEATERLVKKAGVKVFDCGDIIVTARSGDPSINMILNGVRSKVVEFPKGHRKKE
jgi:hypothetical protein